MELIVCLYVCSTSFHNFLKKFSGSNLVIKDIKVVPFTKIQLPDFNIKSRGNALTPNRQQLSDKGRAIKVLVVFKSWDGSAPLDQL